MAIVCIAGTGPEIGKTAVAELVLAGLPGAMAARVRVADEIPEAEAASLPESGYLLSPQASGDSNHETTRLLAAGAQGVSVLLAEPRGLEAGLKAMLSRVPPGANLVVEGNAYLWAAAADAAVMVLGPGPSGKGPARVRQSARELFAKIDIWAWNTRGDYAAEGFFEFPQTLDRMGFRGSVSNRADFHHVNPRDGNHSGNEPFIESLRQAIERKQIRRESDEFLRRAGFDV